LCITAAHCYVVLTALQYLSDADWYAFDSVRGLIEIDPTWRIGERCTPTAMRMSSPSSPACTNSIAIVHHAKSRRAVDAARPNSNKILCSS
jgi:hypothetical protein